MVARMRCAVGLLGLVVAVAVAACQTAPAAPPDPARVDVGEPFTLAAGQSATVDGQVLKLRFDSVLSDSRCPKLVSCFWTGEARLTVFVEQKNHEPVPVEFNTNPAPGLNKQEAQAGPYEIRLISLDPYPQTPANIPLDEYRAVLRVDKN